MRFPIQVEISSGKVLTATRLSVELRLSSFVFSSTRVPASKTAICLHLSVRNLGFDIGLSSFAFTKTRIPVSKK